jgi:hypothetical protein
MIGAMSERKLFFAVFAKVGADYSPIRTIKIDGEMIYPGTKIPGHTKVGEVELRRLTAGAFDVREEDGGAVLVIEAAHTNA